MSLILSSIFLIIVIVLGYIYNSQLNNIDFNPKEKWTYLTINTFDEWERDFKMNHKFSYWIDRTLFDGRNLWDYAPHYSLSHPWEGLKYARRHLKWGWQRLFRGWDDRVIWSIDYHLAKNIPVWMRELKVRHHGIPGRILVPEDYVDESRRTSDETFQIRINQWNKILEDIAKGFDAYLEIEDLPYASSDEVQTKMEDFEKGFDLFREWFGDFWD